MFSLASASLALAAAGVAVAAVPNAGAEAPNHPWYVKFASSQIVDFCCWGGMMGGGGYSTVGGGALSTVAFSSYFTETFNQNTATTLYTTIPGSVVTIYGSPGVATTSLVEPTTLTSVFTPVAEVQPTAPAVADARPTAHGLLGMIEEVEKYAHALAEAIVAPAEMTALLSSAGDDLMERGFIHATRAEMYLSQASRAFEALQTDPAYSAQSARLAAQPTHINFQKAFARATQSHSAGYERFLQEPQGRSVGSQVRNLAEKFLNVFGQ